MQFPFLSYSLVSITFTIGISLAACNKNESSPDMDVGKTVTKDATSPRDAEAKPPLFEKKAAPQTTSQPISPPASPNSQKKKLHPQSTGNTKKPTDQLPAGKRKPSLTELPVDNPVSLPLDRQLTDTDGRTLNVIITARYEKELAVIRKKDSKSFNLPIDKLSDTDIAFALKLPISDKPKKIDPIIVRHEKMLVRYKKDMLRLREKLTSGTLNTSQMRAVVSDQKRLDIKMEDIKNQIKERKQH